MKFSAAYMLAFLGGNSNPSAHDVKAILESVGAEVDDGRIELVLSEAKGNDITELMASGREIFAYITSGGRAVAVAAPVGSVGGGAVTPAGAEPKKEELLEEKEESDDDLGFGLFD